MEMRHEMSPELVLEQHGELLIELRTDLNQLSHFIKGNGDPTKGLLWLAADLSRLLASQATITQAYQADFLAHIKEGGHVQHRQESVWGRLAYDVARQAVTLAVGALLVIFLLGLRTWAGVP